MKREHLFKAHCPPLIRNEGKNFCLPENDEAAITAFEKLLLQQPNYIVVGWPCFWRLDHYQKFAARPQQYNCIMRNERLIVFEIG